MSARNHCVQIEPWLLDHCMRIEPRALGIASRLSVEEIYKLAWKWGAGSNPSRPMPADEYEVLAAARELLYVALSVVEPAVEDAFVEGDNRR